MPTLFGGRSAQWASLVHSVIFDSWNIYLASGKFGFGYKFMYITGVLWFALWSLICGFSAYAKSAVFFDVCRALQGAGLALPPNGIAVLGHYYPPGSMKKNIVCACSRCSTFWIQYRRSIFRIFFAMKVWWKPWTSWVCGIASVCLYRFVLPVVPKKIGTPSERSLSIGINVGNQWLDPLQLCMEPRVQRGLEKTVYNYVLLIVSSQFGRCICHSRGLPEASNCAL